MDTPTGKIKPSPRGDLARETIKLIQTVALVAVILATLFTAWTDPGLLPGNLGKNYTINILPTGEGQSQNPQSTTPRSKPLIGLVAGHSGNDSGAVCPDGLTEVSLNQEIAAYVQKLLVEKNIDVDILKEFDDRLNGYQALAILSIHADSCEYINDQATGFKIASALSNPHPERSARLTACLRTRYAQKTGLTLHNSITVDMTSYHAFDEINNETTAAIIEVGFMNLDRQLLTQQTELVAQGIAAGILCFVNNEDATLPPSP
jgi:N-acetylmuramoyl-L-alanine amidase